MFENIMNFFKKLSKKEGKASNSSKDAAKERLHLVLMQDRANVSADFLELMKQEIIEVIKKYIDVDEREIDVRLTNKENGDGTNGAPALYANIPILNIKNESRKVELKKEEIKKEEIVKKEEKEKTDKRDNKKSEKGKDKKEKQEEIKEETKTQEDTKKEKDNDKKENSEKEEQNNKLTKEKIKSENN